MGAEILFLDDNAWPHSTNIVNECLQSEDIIRMERPAYSPDLNPVEHVLYMLGRRVAARQPHPTCLPELRRALHDEWCNIPEDQIDNLILSMLGIVRTVLHCLGDLLLICINNHTKHAIVVNRRLPESGSGHMKSSVSETPVPSVEVFMSRISVTAGRIRDMPKVFDNVRNSMQLRFQACQMTSGHNCEHMLQCNLSMKCFLSL
ncbi:transposable element Tcb2 transposase [Trichonephila clavipes]|nr:transposable element Tcb2 transposase [Trichonephila clavipes]